VLVITTRCSCRSSGLGPGWVDRPQTAEYLLQESLSAIRSGRRLMIRAAEVLAG
jgi:hypothetical protein